MSGNVQRQTLVVLSCIANCSFQIMRGKKSTADSFTLTKLSCVRAVNGPHRQLGVQKTRLTLQGWVPTVLHLDGTGIPGRSNVRESHPTPAAPTTLALAIPDTISISLYQASS